jgi:hypothetical protein
MATWEQILKKNAFVTTRTYCSNEAEAEPDYRGIGIVENTTHYVKGGLPTISVFPDYCETENPLNDIVMEDIV